MSLLTHINQKMHSGACPGVGSLGECAAVQTIGGQGDKATIIAALYLWSAAKDLTAATVASWFQEFGCDEIIISHVLHDTWNETHEGLCTDGSRHWEAQFQADPARVYAC